MEILLPPQPTVAQQIKIADNLLMLPAAGERYSLSAFSEQGLRRWMVHTGDDANFDRWLAWALEYTDPAEAEK